MYKSKLQELCQQKAWKLPEYKAIRDGPDHNPRFTATVIVRDLSFCSDSLCKSSKEAQNDAARLAVEHLSRPEFTGPAVASTFASSSGSSTAAAVFATRGTWTEQKHPAPQVTGDAQGQKDDSFRFSGSSSPSTSRGNVFATRGTLQPRTLQIHPVPQVNGNASGQKNDVRFADVQHLYKTQLQNYVQKKNLELPVYACEREGPPHASIFKCKVTIDGKTYESLEFSSTLREAEHAAAKVALTSLFADGLQEEDSGLYKNLLQELAQKEAFSLPVYHTNRSGEAHIPSFISTVEIEGQIYVGEQAKTKKQAEMNAAKVAYNTLKEGEPSKSQRILLPVPRGQEAHDSPSSVSSSDIIAELQEELRSKLSMTPNPVLNSSGQAEQSREKPEVSDTTTINGGLSSEDSVNACQQDSFQSVPSPEDGSSSSSTLSECSNSLGINYSTTPPAGLSANCRRVVVLPSTPNMVIPDGATKLPISDDDWVAMELRCN